MSKRLMIKALDGAQNYVTKMNELGMQRAIDDINVESGAAFAFYREATNFIEMCREEYASLSDSEGAFENITKVYVDTLNFYKQVIRGFAYRYCHMVSISSISPEGESVHKVRLVKKLDDWLRYLDLSYRYATSSIKELNLIGKPRHVEDDIDSAIEVITGTHGPEGVINYIVFYLEELRDAFVELEEWRTGVNG